MRRVEGGWTARPRSSAVCSRGLGLAGAAGLNAYIPLLGVAVLGRMHVLALSPPFDLLMHPVVIGALGVLLALELVVDKVPAADHVNDVVQTFIRPAAGAVLFLGGAARPATCPRSYCSSRAC